MKIAIIAPIEEAVPPLKYGGTERIVYEVAHGVGKAGYEVDLYAAGDSRQEPFYTLYPTTETHLRAISPYKEVERMRDVKKLMVLSETVEKLQSKHYDLIHNHVSWRYLIFSHFVHSPVLTTHHGPLSVPHHNLLYEKHKEAFHLSISDNQRKDFPNLNWVATVYNGVNTNELAYKEMPEEDYLLFIARISPQKGPIAAAETAIQLGKPLLMTGKVDIADKEFYDKEVVTYINNPLITFKGELGLDEKLATYQNAKALIAPIQWEEPFGLMFAESMSCGTPVICYSRGSAPEIVVDGVTGFLVNQSADFIRGDYIIKKTGIDGLKEAVERIYAMSDGDYKAMRKNARDHVTKHFTIEKMVEGYLQVYEKILGAV